MSKEIYEDYADDESDWEPDVETSAKMLAITLWLSIGAVCIGVAYLVTR